MNSSNNITLIGRPFDHQSATTKAGTAICEFTLDCETGSMKRPRTAKFLCRAYGELATLCGDYLRNAEMADVTPRQSGMIVVGKFEERKVETKTGQTRRQVEIIVDDFGPSHKLPLLPNVDA